MLDKIHVHECGLLMKLCDINYVQARKQELFYSLNNIQ